MKTLHILAILAIALFAATGCQKDVGQAPPQSQVQAETPQYFEPSQTYLAMLDKFARTPSISREACQWIEVPAGSNNALAQALNDVCSGGVIYLKSGVHTETRRVTITKSVIIMGEAGSSLKVQSVLLPTDAAGKYTLAPAFHVLNAPNTAFVDLDIQPITGDGADASATAWKANGNAASNNVYAGYFLIASAHWNVMNNNTATGNGSYDIELNGDTNRSGFFAPATYNNTISAPQSQRIKDCGIGNTITGGTMINTATDRCL